MEKLICKYYYVKLIAVATGLVTSSFVFAIEPPPQMLESPTVLQGISIKSIKDHPVPDILKNQAKKEIEEMKSKGQIDSSDESISYIDKAVSSISTGQNNSVKSIDRISAHLQVTPAYIQGAHLLGATPSGVKTESGWTGVNRVFQVPKLGVVMLEEINYVASGGGLVMIEEAINQDINGHPAILRVKNSQSGKSITELTWATDHKIYNLGLNRAVKGDALTVFLNLAKSIKD